MYKLQLFKNKNLNDSNSYSLNKINKINMDTKLLYMLFISENISILESFFDAEIKSVQSANFRRETFFKIGSITKEPNLLIIKPIK